MDCSARFGVNDIRSLGEICGIRGKDTKRRQRDARYRLELAENHAPVSVAAPGETSEIIWLVELLEPRAEAEREPAGRKSKKPEANGVPARRLACKSDCLRYNTALLRTCR